MKVGLIVGSLRKESWNRKVAEVVKDLFPKNIEVDFIEINNLAIYNEDLELDEPDTYRKFREEIKNHDAFIFFTPEYNRSYSAAIKNALDIGSKSKEGNLWSNKVAGVMSASTGGFGGMAANHALRQVFVFLNLIPLQQPEVYLSKVHTLFVDGEMNKGTKEFLQTAVDAFLAQAEKLI